jgi:hypothetical protein
VSGERGDDGAGAVAMGASLRTMKIFTARATASRSIAIVSAVFLLSP